MARIIEILKSEERTVTHKVCGAKIGYYENELIRRIHEDYGGGKEVWWALKCPHCSGTIACKSPR